MRCVLFLLGLLGVVTARGESTVTVPWSEFNELYQERLESRIKDELAPDEVKPEHVFDTASYQLNVTDSQVVGRADVEGRVLQGDPGRIQLFGDNIAITNIKQSMGGHLGANANGYYFIPQRGSKFRTSFEFSAPITDSNGNKTLTIKPPSAVSNSLELTLPSHLRLLDSPLLNRINGHWYFPPVDTLTLRFQELVRDSAEQGLAINTLTRFEWRGGHMVVTSFFQPVHALPESFAIQLDSAAANVALSLPSESYDVAANGLVRVTVDGHSRDPFIVQYEISSDGNDYEISLPRIENNTGREGDFFLVQTPGLRIKRIEEKQASVLPPHVLPKPLVSFASLTESYLRLDAGADAVSLRVRRLPAAPTPKLVLDTVHFYASFIDNGDVFSVLRAEIPSRAEDKLVLRAVDDAEIWSVKVNDEPADLYSDDEGQWIIPLHDSNASSVELAYVQRREKLGLKGRLDVTVPATGLSARHLNVA